MFTTTPQLYYTLSELYNIIGRYSGIEDGRPVNILFKTELPCVTKLHTHPQSINTSVSITYVPLTYIFPSGDKTTYYVIKGSEHIFENIGR